MKKLKIFLLTLLMVTTLLPVNTLADENNSSKEPNVLVFATKEQLMDGTFAPNEKGVPENIGKIVFGKNNTGAPQEWYILGKDNGITNGEGKVIDNTVIFAASPILTEQAFDLDPGGAAEKTDPSLWNDCDYNGSTIITVYPNHYGASDLHAKLKDIAKDTSHFTTAEQSMMNDTTITTYDYRNNTSYTTTDKLYVLEKGESKTIIEAGSGNNKLLAMSSYWNNGGNFWLRTPTQGSDHAFFAISGDECDLLSIDISINIRPASNLNLTDVLFASAAKEGSSVVLANDAAMYLRFDGSNKGLGSIYYTDDELYFHSTSKCDLFVQGKNGDKNWVFNTLLSAGNFIIPKQDIIRTLASFNISNIDFSQCQIWIEKKEDDGLIYAVEAKAVQEISSLDVDIAIPEANKALATNATCNTTGVNVDSITWDPNNTTVGYSETYTASVKLSAASGYKFADKVTPTLNGKKLSPVSKNSDGTLTVTYQFTTKDTIKEIKNPTITVKNGTDISTIQFPDKVTVTGNSSNTYQVIITEWEPDPNNNYDQDCKDEQILKYYANLKEIPGELEYRNNEAPDTTLTIIVEAVGIVPPATPEPTSTPAPTVVTTTTDDGYVVPNTSVK